MGMLWALSYFLQEAKIPGVFSVYTHTDTNNSFIRVCVQAEKPALILTGFNSQDNIK